MHQKVSWSPFLKDLWPTGSFMIPNSVKVYTGNCEMSETDQWDVTQMLWCERSCDTMRPWKRILAWHIGESEEVSQITVGQSVQFVLVLCTSWKIARTKAIIYNYLIAERTQWGAKWRTGYLFWIMEEFRLLDNNWQKEKVSFETNTIVIIN